MTNCVDLKAQFGNRYQVVYEASYCAQYGANGRIHDPWLLVIKCRHGEIYPHGGNFLGASTRGRGTITSRLARLSCVQVVQDGDDGINAIFQINDFDKVAAILLPKRRRRLTPEQTAERAERLRKYQFSPASQSDSRGVRRDSTTLPTGNTLTTAASRLSRSKSAQGAKR